MAKCRLCERSYDEIELGDDGICSDCRRRHALTEDGAPLRPQVPCSRCNGRQLVRCLSIRERAATGSDYVSEYIAPLAATYQHIVNETFFAGRKEATPDVLRPVGVFEAYICRSCGFVELYARDAGKIPIGPEYNTQLIDIPEPGPYR